ncbi:tetratricopeptide repeat protein [Tenacibaculum maritimum]|uniref:tetratricopeptide repeat protein n=5 Tax=Tenacibaculum maritimum TaxID=107401 RepID=UPI0012E67903|nr:tetratricopeptide repeat protein [Tenacibaculum maritimum]MCD9612201.1 tetratricopeptide repeat protein [Tenacibaculum maritimum]CAA0148843.1 Probable lipoprotein precursor [Tenacibaculum maritimum]CAA0158981.1 Probable lipoprotein precursor [Tenacibaculum maritimum]CAA0170050.1 Probable lipoprotein precursor [Tenacibaculum maritimum]CAA0220399.1 Probable lipoprotein precursor [Tenacibaculum maritimum]
MKIIYNVKLVLALIMFASTFLSCKKSSSEMRNKVSVLEKKNKNDEKTILQTCSLKKLDTKISLLEDSDKGLYLFIEEKERSLEKTLNLENFNEVSSVKLQCNSDETFQVIFSEKLGNSYQNTIHHFRKSAHSIFNLNTIYIQISNRDKVTLLYTEIKPVKISNYNASIPMESEYKKIYTFSGFQENKTPSIDDFFQKIEVHKGEKNTLKNISNEFVLDFLLENIAIDKNNLSKYNNIAYYLEQSGLYTEAIYLLERIIKQYPNRTVAYINLGDSYWGVGSFEKAKKTYQIYVKQMQKKGKEVIIPKRVLERIVK